MNKCGTCNGGRSGYKLVSTEMVKNVYGITNMYLFFAKETQIDE